MDFKAFTSLWQAPFCGKMKQKGGEIMNESEKMTALRMQQIANSVADVPANE